MFEDMKNDKSGYIFLQGIKDSDNLEFMKIQNLQIIIEFLYQNLKKFLLYYLTPLFLINLLVFSLLSEYNEQYREGLEFDYAKDTVIGFRSDSTWHGKQSLIALVVVNMMLTLLQIFINMQILRGMGLQFFSRFYSILDFILMVVNVCLFVEFVMVLDYDNEVAYTEYKL